MTETPTLDRFRREVLAFVAEHHQPDDENDADERTMDAALAHVVFPRTTDRLPALDEADEASFIAVSDALCELFRLAREEDGRDPTSNGRATWSIDAAFPEVPTNIEDLSPEQFASEWMAYVVAAVDNWLVNAGGLLSAVCERRPRRSMTATTT